MNQSLILKRIRRYWLGPFLVLLALFLLFWTLGGSGGIVNKIYLDCPKGELPEIDYLLGFKGWLTLILLIFSTAAMVFTMREWARYYLNRKLVLSYLVLALFPFLTTLIIFLLGTRALFGIIAANTVENTLTRVARDLDSFNESIMAESQRILSDSEPQNVESILRPMVENAQRTKVGSLAYSDLSVEIFVGTDLLLRIYPDGRLFPDAKSIVPAWLDRAEQTAMVQRNGQLYIQQFSRQPAPGGELIILTVLPVNQSFINYLRETLDVDISLNHPQGLWRYEALTQDGIWFFRLLFKPFRSQWEFLAMDWEKGSYQPAAQIQFNIAPDTLLSRWSSKDVHFFGEGEKEIQFYFIFGVTLLLLVAQLSAFIFGIYLVSYITRSLNSLATGHEKVAEGDFDYRLPHLGQDQLGAMADSFNHMVGNISFLLDQVREKEKYQEELRIAREIQMSLLPDPEKFSFREQITAVCIPARDVGGDYYDVMLTEQGNIGLFIADVSGKGTSAAFYMAELKGVLIALRKFWDHPLELMQNVNEIITPALKAKVFISAAYLLIDPIKKRGALARAGHSPALHVKADGHSVSLQPPGMALGLALNPVFSRILKVAEFDLEPEDKIILYTDGLDEMSFENELYGVDRLQKLVVEHVNQPAKVLRDLILQDVLKFLSHGQQSDDLTLVVASLPKDPTDGPL
ncbi:MAG: SpoIIE family protein phosphatase [Acidobacteria bacterium]|nr:SpoIIE family protein phosphatase [Acidobacteriota bacterium]MCB9396196.1 SpoIIE family protein phosphatase [Acidobacteriota bacterium]